jgi:hypothetical protein
LKRLRSKLSYSNVIVTVLAFVVLAGGTAYAATEMLPKGSVGTKQLRKEAVTPGKLSKASKAALTGPAGEKGSTGPQGTKGEAGEKGPRGEIGPSDAYEVGDASSVSSVPPLSLELPAGNYVASAKYTAFNATTSPALIECVLSGGGHASELYSSISMAGIIQTSGSGSNLVQLASPGPVTLTCSGNATFGYANITAIKVGTLH